MSDERTEPVASPYWGRRHTRMALDIARETGWNLDEYAKAREWEGVGVGPVGHHRDSDTLAESNWDVVSSDLLARFPDSVDSARFRHWAVGWVEDIVWDTGDDAVVDAVTEWADRLAAYPVADEEHYSAAEWAEVCEWVEQEAKWLGVPAYLDMGDVLAAASNAGLHTVEDIDRGSIRPVVLDLLGARSKAARVEWYRRAPARCRQATLPGVPADIAWTDAQE